MSVFPTKPLGHKSYGSIGHLPGSRMDANHKKYATGKVSGEDFGVHEGQAAICTIKSRDKHDTIIVQEKVDGSNVAVANIDGVVTPLIRAGYPAVSSKYEQHRLFAAWVFERTELFAWLKPGERLCGEWLAQAHGTRHDLVGRSPFVAFDLIRGHDRALYRELTERATGVEIVPLLSMGRPISIHEAMTLLGSGRYGSIDPPEGCVWRVERHGKVDFLAKYVRPEKVDGCYLPEMSGKEAVWNWRP